MACFFVGPVGRESRFVEGPRETLAGESSLAVIQSTVDKQGHTGGRLETCTALGRLGRGRNGHLDLDLSGEFSPNEDGLHLLHLLLNQRSNLSHLHSLILNSSRQDRTRDELGGRKGVRWNKRSRKHGHRVSCLVRKAVGY
jgi:hypothetical protein